MTIIVDTPDGGTAEFPDGTSPDLMRNALRAKFGGGPAKDVAKQMSSGDELAYRGAILPIGKTKEGKIVPALPQALYQAAGITKDLMTGKRAPADVTPKEALSMGLLGAAPSPAVGGASRAAGAISELSGLEKPTFAESTEALKATAGTLYKQAEQSGVSFNPESFRGMVSDMIPELKKAGFDKDIEPRAAAVLGRLAKESENMKPQTDIRAVTKVIDGKRVVSGLENVEKPAQPLSLQDFDLLRQVANSLYKTNDANEQRIAGIIIDHMDDLVANPSAFRSGSKEGIDAITAARSAWSRAAKSDRIDQIFERAANRAPGTPALGLEGQLRNGFKELANNRNQMKRFSADEQDAIRQAARGGKLQNAMVKLGKYSLTAGFFAGVLTGKIGIEALQNPELLAIPAIAGIARYAAGRVRSGQAETVAEMVRGGKPAAEFFKRRSKLRSDIAGGAGQSVGAVGTGLLSGGLLPSDYSTP